MRRQAVVVVPEVKKNVGDLLALFLQQLGNQFCADCLEKNPQWVAYPHGSIICDNCAGAHRSLGSHVSQVKSIIYDKWDMTMYTNLEKCGGNTKINAKYQKYCPKFDQLNPHSNADDREKIIKRKYEFKLYTTPQKTDEKEEANKRLAHYFLIVSKNKMILPEIPEKQPELNKNMKSPRKSQPRKRNFIVPDSIFDCEFDTSVKYRYPKEDWSTCPLPGRVFDFIFPEPLKVKEKIAENALLPEKRAFVLTDAEGNKQYGVTVVFWERVSPMDILSMYETLNNFRKECGHNDIASMPGAVYSPKAIALISHWPFFDAFSLYLQTLYRITKTPSVPIPLERYMINFMHEVPAPPMGKTSVQFVVGDNSITLKRHAPNSLPFLYVNGLNLFRCLSLGNVLTVFNALLQEQKMVLISKHLHLLLEVSETLTMLLFPFQLQGVYMPLLPSKLLDFLHSPVPFLAGVHPKWIKGQHYSDVVFVYLDDNTIMTTSDQVLVPLPKRSKEKLEKQLQTLLPWLHHGSPSKKNKSHHVSQMAEKKNNDMNGAEVTKTIAHNLSLLPVSNFLTSGSTISAMNNNNNSKNNNKLLNDEEYIFREIQKAFLKFFTGIMENCNNKYKEKEKHEKGGQEYQFFKFNKQQNIYEFEGDKFLEEGVDKSHRPFLEVMTRTQLFMAFCQEREELLESKSKDIPDEIRYFNEELIAKKNRSAMRTKKQDTPFLDDHSMDINSVFVANPPNLNDLDQSEYNYDAFPFTFRESRFGKIRKVNAEWNNNTGNRRSKARHVTKQTSTALQQLMAMQHAAHVDKVKSWDNFTVNVLIVQKYIRMCLERKKKCELRSNIVKLQRYIRIHNDTMQMRSQFETTRNNAIVLQSVFRTYLTVQKNKEKLYSKSVRTLQAAIRGYVYHSKYVKMMESTKNLQAAIRTRYCMMDTANKIDASNLVCTYLRTSICRTNHIERILQISRCQAVLRGTLVRNQQKTILKRTLSKLRTSIMSLWRVTHTAYMYRAKFWIVYEQSTYLNLAIHYEEIERLNNLSERFERNQASLLEAKNRFDTEKKELKRLLKDELAPNIRQSLYTSWGISVKSKHKKESLISRLFTESVDPKLSATALLTICSSHSASILDVTSQVELRKADRIRDNLLLTVFSSLSSMQSLNKSLLKQQKKCKKQQAHIMTLSEDLSHAHSMLPTNNHNNRMPSAFLRLSTQNSAMKSKSINGYRRFSETIQMNQLPNISINEVSKTPDSSKTTVTGSFDKIQTKTRRRNGHHAQHSSSHSQTNSASYGHLLNQSSNSRTPRKFAKRKHVTPTHTPTQSNDDNNKNDKNNNNNNNDTNDNDVP